MHSWVSQTFDLGKILKHITTLFQNKLWTNTDAKKAEHHITCYAKPQMQTVKNA